MSRRRDAIFVDSFKPGPAAIRRLKASIRHRLFSPTYFRSHAAMTILSIDDFTLLVQTWAVARSDSFGSKWPVKGGWEGWAQVDLVSEMLQDDPTLDILREQAIYRGGRRRVDLLLNANAMMDDDMIPVEIKAESLQNCSAFVDGVLKDLDKLETQRNAQFSACDCVMMAIAFSQSGVDGLTRIATQTGPIFASILGPNVPGLLAGEIDILFSVWRRHEGWVRPDAPSGNLLRPPAKFKLNVIDDAAAEKAAASFAQGTKRPRLGAA
ncbi:hypothetical protein AB4851_14980 [Burkholderia sp. 22PA0099]|uniref:hypothetical protein n=1 Tax=Burkholderia sp. 22PA0099 TaxID=3237372 RepID=UPI0039C0E8C9